MTSPSGLGIRYEGAQVSIDMADKEARTPITSEEFHSVKWLTALYTSEFFFLFHLPIFVELPIGAQKIPSKEAFSLISREQRTAYLRSGYSPPSQWFQIVIFGLRSALNLACLVLIFYDLRKSKIWDGSDLHEVTEVFTGFKASIGWYLFLASLGLYGISYCHQRYHLAYEESRNPGSVVVPQKLYWLSHLSVFNFSLDFPAAAVPSVQVTRALVCILNIIALIIVAFVTLFEERFIKAWGCYPPDTSIGDYKYGICPAFYDRPYMPVCTQPGIRCGREDESAHAAFQHSLMIAQMLLSVSVTFYILSVSPKLTYWRAITEQTTIDDDTKKRQ